MKKILKDIQKHLLSGVSFMMPIVVAGGVILAISLLGAEQTSTGMVPQGELMTFINQLGKAGMTMMIPVFAAYIAYSVAGKPALTPGFILGFIANSTITFNGTEVKSGFIGALIMGLAAGYFVQWMKSWKVAKHKLFRSVTPILIIPIISVLSLGLIYYFIIGYPISFVVNSFTKFMTNLQGGSKAVFAVAMGVFSEIDFGGPITKAVSMFTLTLLNEGILEPNGIFRVLVAVPPIGIFLATIIAKEKFSESERDSAKAVGIMGMLGITEGAIPYAIKDPKAVFPSTIGGCIVGALIAAFTGVTCPVPHGGFIVLPVVGNKLAFVIAIIVGSLTTALLLKILKKDYVEEF